MRLPRLKYATILQYVPNRPRRAYLAITLGPIVLATALGIHIASPYLPSGFVSQFPTILPNFDWIAAAILVCLFASVLLDDARTSFSLTRPFNLTFSVKNWAPFTAPDKSALLEREQEVDRLYKLILTCGQSIVCVTGRSGVGKTVINELLEKRIKKEGQKVWRLTGVPDQLAGNFLRNATKEKFLTVEEVSKLTKLFEEYIDGKCPAEFILYESVKEIIHGQRRESKPNSAAERSILIIDQAERLFSAGPRHDTAHKVDFILSVLIRISESERCIVQLSLRADVLYHCLDRLNDIVGGDRTPEVHISDRVIFEIVRGVTTIDHNSDVRTLQERFDESWGGSDEDSWNRFRAILKLNDPTQANTFYTQVLGGLIEELRARSSAQQKPKVHDHRKSDSARTRSEGRSSKFEETITAWLEDGTGQKIEFADIFDVIYDDLIAVYSLEHREYDARKSLGRILYALACLAKHDANPIAVNRIANFSHLPVLEVRDGLLFLKDKRLLNAESIPGGEGYTFKHDVIATDILHTDRFQLTTEYRDSISSLAARDSGSRQLKRRLGDEQFFESSWSGLFRLNDWRVVLKHQWDRYVILICMLACIFRATYPHIAEPLWENLKLSKSLNDFFHTSPQYTGNWTYIWIILAQFAWVDFMYSLYHGYFKHTVPSTRQLRFRILAPLGALVGVFFAFNPVLSALPVALLGASLGIFILREQSLLRQTPGSQLKDTLLVTRYRQWGRRTLINMALGAFAVTAFSLHLLRHWMDNGWWGYIFIATCQIGFMVFYVTVRPIQGDRYAFSDMLALYDRGHGGL